MTGVSVAALEEVVHLVQDDLGEVERRLDEELRSEVPLVGEIGRYVGASGGKRLRPVLLLLASRLSGYRGERATALAALVELLHTATLLHDDVVDEAPLRRGRASVNGRWGNELAVLLGDFLFSRAMAMALSPDDLRLLKLLSEVTQRMIEGEVLEIERCGDLTLTAEERQDIIRRKTAELFSASLRMGAMVGGASDETERALAGYGLSLGICFQMVDDLLDVSADEKLLGKPVGNDLREGKLTLPVILTLRRAGRPALDSIRAVVEDRGYARVGPREIARLVRESGALDESWLLAERHAEAARRALLRIEPSPYRDALMFLPDFVLGCGLGRRPLVKSR
jgi:octaprenyl-diphosphate synthase